jgi:hypothetical protein
MIVAPAKMLPRHNVTVSLLTNQVEIQPYHLGYYHRDFAGNRVRRWPLHQHVPLSTLPPSPPSGLHVLYTLPVLSHYQTMSQHVLGEGVGHGTCREGGGAMVTRVIVGSFSFHCEGVE